MSQPTCELCSRPLSDTAYVCSPCTKKLGEHLGQIVDLAPEVESAILKLVRYSSASAGESRAPFDDKRAERAAAVGNTVATWARHVSESRGVEIPRLLAKPVVLGPLCYRGIALSSFLDADHPRPCLHGSCEEIRPPRPMLGAAAAASFLAQREQLNWLRHQREARQAFGELRDAASELQRIVDRPRDLWYAGPCRAELPDGGRCEVDIYAVPGTRTVRCRECKAEWDAQNRRDWLMDAARDQLLHAEWIARALTALGVEDMTGSRVRGMARHGRLVAKGTNAAGDPTYRVGDVLAVIDEQKLIEEDKRRRREAKAARAEARKAAAEAGAA